MGILKLIKGFKKEKPLAPQPEQDYAIEVLIYPQLLRDAVEDPEKWKILWTKIIPEAFDLEARKLKAFALNGFKQLENNDQIMACREKMLKLESPRPTIRVVKTFPPGLKNRSERRNN